MSSVELIQSCTMEVISITPSPDVGKTIAEILPFWPREVKQECCNQSVWNALRSVTLCLVPGNWILRKTFDLHCL